MSPPRHLGVLLTSLALVAGAVVHGAPAPLPPKPADFVLDQAGVFTPAARQVLAERLAQFERETSNQILVAVLPRVPDDEALEDFTQRTAEAWGAGTKDRDNGIVLFVFPDSRELRIEVGYGLEGAVPDALAHIIIQDDIVPGFRAGNMAGGIERGVAALMAATKGEYHGTGRTMAETQPPEEFVMLPLFWLLVIVIVIIAIQRSNARGGRLYQPSGRRDVWFPSSGSGLGGGSRSSGGSFGGGGFSGGGGSFGGGGASGRW